MASRGYIPQSPQGAKSVNGQQFHTIKFTFAHKAITQGSWITRFVVPFEGFLRFDFSSPWLRCGKDGRGTTGLLIPTVFLSHGVILIVLTNKGSTLLIYGISEQRSSIYTWGDDKTARTRKSSSRNGTKGKDIFGYIKTTLCSIRMISKREGRGLQIQKVVFDNSDFRQI